MSKREEPEKYGLPSRVFLYTLDQLAVIMNTSVSSLKKEHIHFDGRSIGNRTKGRMLARNIADKDSRPDWRVAEQELIRYMKYRGFKFYERGWIEH